MNLDFCQWCGCSEKFEVLTDNQDRFAQRLCNPCMELFLEAGWETPEPETTLSQDLA